jgi:hypothetical protein
MQTSLVDLQNLLFPSPSTRRLDFKEERPHFGRNIQWSSSLTAALPVPSTAIIYYLYGVNPTRFS